MFWISAHVLIVLLTLLPVVPCSHGTGLAVWMQEDTSGVFLKDYSYSSIWSTVGRSPLSRTWLCLARKSRSFSCHKTRRHISMMILLLMLSGDVEINPGPVTRRNQSEQRDFQSGPFMEKYRDRFLRCMHTCSIASTLSIYNVIPEGLYHQIDQKLITGSEANAKLYLHLRSNAKSDTIHHLCDVMTGQNDYPLMKELGEDMKKDVDLPPSSQSSQPPTVPHPPHPEPTPPSSTLDDETSRMFKQCYDKLKRHYRNLPTVAGDGRTPDVQFNNLATVERKCYGAKQEKDISDFLQATIHGIDRYCETSEKIDYENILNCGEVISGKRVIISGAPGCGKTTLSRKLCKDLYSQSLPNQYHLVLLVELRRLKVDLDSSEVDIDLLFLLRDFQRVLNLPELCQSLEGSGGEGVALILDGFDEVADRLGKISFLSELLSVDYPYLSQCDVFVTTRPSRCPDLISLIQQPHRHVEILGFTDADINGYIKSFFTGVHPKDRRKAEDTSKDVILRLESLPLVRGMCHTPVVLKIVCKVQDRLGSEPLPETLSGIFVMYICHQLVDCLRSACHHTTGRITNVLQVPSDLFPGFYPLCEVAYKCCIDKKGQRLILTDDDLGDVKEYLERGSIYNLLFSEPVDEAASGVLYQFHHKTVQETMAAIHIARQSEEDQETIWKEAYGRPEMAEVWKVYCGLTKLEHVDLISLSHSFLSEHARHVIPWEKKEDNMLVMTSLFESSNSSVSAKVLPAMLKNFMHVRLKTPYDVHVLIYSFQHHHTLQRLDLEVDSNFHSPLLTDDFISALASLNSLRELKCSIDGDCGNVWEVFTEMFRKPHNLKDIELSRPPVEAVLSALSGPIEKLRLSHSREWRIASPKVYSEEEWRRIDEAVRASTCLKLFAVTVPYSQVAIPAVFIEHLCLNETLTELHIDFDRIDHNIPAQSLKSLLVHREKCRVKMPLTRQQWCAVLSGLRDAKKLKELSVDMRCPKDPSLNDQSDQCLTSEELQKLVATSEQLVKVGVLIHPEMLKCVEDLLLAIVKGVSRNKNIVSIDLVNNTMMSELVRPDLDFVFKAPVNYILDTLAHSEHITHVMFIYINSRIHKLLGDDWCQLLVDGPMSRPVCHLILDLTPAECGVLLNRVCDAERLEELTLEVWSSSKDEPDVKTVEDVMSNCTLKKLRIVHDISGLHSNPHWCNLWNAVVRGMATSNNDVDFVLTTNYRNRGSIMSQIPSQHMKKFEVVERSDFTYIISKPRVPTGDEERSLPSDESVSEMKYSTVPGQSPVSVLTKKWSPSTSPSLPGAKLKRSVKKDSEVVPHEEDLERLCWIPFGLQTLEVGPEGGTFPLQPKTEGCDDRDLIRLEVPGSALRLDVGKKLLVRYGILVDGPFSLEDNYKLASMVVYIYFNPALTTEPLNLHLPHWSSGEELLFVAMAPHKVDGKNEFKFQFETGLPSSKKTGVIPIDGHSSLFAQAIEEGSSEMFYAFSNELRNGAETTLQVYVTYASPVWCKIMNEHICKYKVPPGPSPFEMSSEAKIIPQLMDNEGLGWRAALIGTTELSHAQVDYQLHRANTGVKLEEAVCVHRSYPPVISCTVQCSDRALEGRQPRLVRLAINRDDGNQSSSVIMRFFCTTYYEEPPTAPVPGPSNVHASSNPKEVPTSHVRARDVLKTLNWHELVGDVQDMLTELRVDTLERQYKLIDSSCNAKIQSLLERGKPDRAATTLIEYFEANHSGVDLLRFCEFLRHEAEEAGGSAVLEGLADKLEGAIKDQEPSGSSCVCL